MKTLLPLVTKLKACASHETVVTRELFLESWDELQREGVTHLDKPTLSVMAALVLHDERFAKLLDGIEQRQLQSLVKLVLERYEQQTNPPNKLGKLIAGSIKKET